MWLENNIFVCLMRSSLYGQIGKCITVVSVSELDHFDNSFCTESENSFQISG